MNLYIFAYLATSPLTTAFVEFQIVGLPQLTLHQNQLKQTTKNYLYIYQPNCSITDNTTSNPLKQTTKNFTFGIKQIQL